MKSTVLLAVKQPSSLFTFMIRKYCFFSFFPIYVASRNSHESIKEAEPENNLSP